MVTPIIRSNFLKNALACNTAKGSSVQAQRWLTVGQASLDPHSSFPTGDVISLVVGQQQDLQRCQEHQRVPVHDLLCEIQAQGSVQSSQNETDYILVLI